MNPRQPDPQSGALPTELYPPYNKILPVKAILAGVARFELARARVKVLCLTAWRYPIVVRMKGHAINCAHTSAFASCTHIYKQQAVVVCFTMFPLLGFKSLHQNLNSRDNVVRMKGLEPPWSPTRS